MRQEAKSQEPQEPIDPRTSESAGVLTRLLQSASSGDRDSLEELVALLHDELRWLAHRHLLRESRGRPMSTTELVNEAFLKLLPGERLPDRDRHYFLGAASRAMRQVLVEEARRRRALKRPPESGSVPLDAVPIGIDSLTAILEVNSALEHLGAVAPRLQRVVECRFFGGLSVGETAAVLGVSDRTVKREWRQARAWLHHHLQESQGRPEP